MSDASPNASAARREESELDRALRLNTAATERCYGKETARALEQLRAATGDTLLYQAAELHRAFLRRPHLRRIWEPRILSGQSEINEVLEAIR